MQPLQGRFGGAHAIFLLGCVLIGCGLIGCGSGGGDAGDLVITSAAPTSAPSCERSIVSIENYCAEIRLFEVRGDGTRVPYRVYDPDGDGVDYEAPGQVALRFDSDRPNSRRIRFDAELDPSARYDLEVEVYGGDGNGFAGAVVEDIPTDGSDIVVRLYPYRQWGCATAPTSNREPQPRALHYAVPLDDGDVLVFGGVTGAGASPVVHVQSILRSPAAVLALDVELYDSVRHEVEQVRVVNEVPGEISTGVGRVLSGVVYLGASDEPVGGETHRVHRIRVIDGVTMPSDQGASPVLGLDPSGTDIDFDDGFPFVPLPTRAVLAQPIDLVFDAETRTLTVEAADLGDALERGAAVTISEPVATRRLGMPGLSRPPGGFEPGSAIYALDGAGGVEASGALDVSRLGATVTGMDADFVVWGGLGSVDTAGVAVDPASLAVTPLTGPGARAMHTATRLDATSILIAGGLPVSGGRILANGAPSALTTPLAILERTGPGAVAVRAYTSAAYQPTAFHTATLDPELGVVLVGGAVNVSGNRFTPVDSVWSVRGDEVLPLAPLGEARWGHTATVLPGRRVLVWGGFASTDDRLLVRPVGAPEMFFLESAPPTLGSGECRNVDDAPDAAPPDLDAGRPPLLDAGTPPPPDSGPPPMDAGVAPPDAG
ncbi:MAG: hypothetical protein SangKO_079520 [Sandaracinaceae bacterium]